MTVRDKSITRAGSKALLLASCMFVCGEAAAQYDPNGPVALITTFRARPGMRAQFRSVMQTEGVQQLARWKQEGVFASYQVLFTAYAADTIPDMFLILKFDHFADLGRWQRIEQTQPGGLPASARMLASADTSGTADVLKESSVAPPSKDSQYFVLEYDVLIDMPRYSSYVLGYAVPQFEAWEKTGALSSYASYINQNPAGAPWSSLILLEYKDLPSVAKREMIKDAARADLAATNPTWKKWSEDKTAIRKEKAAIPLLSLRLP